MEKRTWKLAVLGAALAVLALMALPAGAQAPESLARALSVLSIGEPEQHEVLTLIPLLAPRIGEVPRWVTLEQALERGWLQIVEKDGGTVPVVWLSNRSDRTIFILGGEILSGARQDRIVRRDLLVSPWRKRLAVPVFCVEEGRWHYTSQSFGSEKNLGTYKLRARPRVPRRSRRSGPRWLAPTKASGWPPTAGPTRMPTATPRWPAGWSRWRSPC
jgi:hypothetical protein